MKSLTIQETQAISGGSVEVYAATAAIITTATILGALTTPYYYSPVIYDPYPYYGYYDSVYYYDYGYSYGPNVVICDEWGCF